jgi:hypothetical protein
LQLPLYTLAVLNSRQQILPVVYMVNSGSTSDTVQRFLEAAKMHARKLQSDFNPGSMHCDDAKAEQRAIRCVPQNFLPNFPK